MGPFQQFKFCKINWPLGLLNFFCWKGPWPFSCKKQEVYTRRILLYTVYIQSIFWTFESCICLNTHFPLYSLHFPYCFCVFVPVSFFNLFNKCISLPQNVYQCIQTVSYARIHCLFPYFIWNHHPYTLICNSYFLHLLKV